MISGPEAALIELVKNAYDADSPDVKIKITPQSIDCPVGAISVIDHGHGMTHDDVLDKWFEPATDEKLLRRYSPGKQRRMLGAKGIGRFAASRLGTKTVLSSFAIDPENKIKEKVLVQVDWNAFSADKYLDEIEVPVLHQKLLNTDHKSGVSLVISDLRDNWSRKRLENLVRELRRVVTPTDTDDEFNIHLDLTDFTLENSGIDGEEVFQKSNFDFYTDDEGASEPDRIVPFRLQDHADYKLVGVFNETGEFNGEFTVCKGDNIPQKLSVSAPPMTQDEYSCGDLRLKINIYDRETDSIEDLFKRMGLDFDRIGIRAARQILTDNAGIAIFRSGFRIRPYGEPENDWLELERQRVQDPSRKLGLSQVSGKVSIEDEEKSGLIERSSREGLEHNGQFTRLKNLIQGVMVHVEERRVAFREKAGLSRKRSGDVSKVKEMASLHAINRAVKKLPAELQEPLLKAISRDAGALAASLDELDEYQKLLQSRASLGLVVAQVIHEGRRILDPMASAARVLYEDRDLLLEESRKGETYRKQFPGYTETIQKGSKDMSRLFKRLDPVSGRRRGRPVVFALGKTVSYAVSLFKDAMKSNDIRLHLELDNDVSLYGYAEDLQAAILNILENAIHWLGVSNQESKNIHIESFDEARYIRLEIENDGPLIDEAYMERLFQPGFSLKSDGTGLGLSIAREACRASKGDLIYKETAGNTCFVIRFPSA